MQGDIQYIADTILLEKTFRIISAVENRPIIKQAFDFQSMLDNIKSTVVSHITSNILPKTETSPPSETGEDTTKQSTGKALIEFFVPAIFFKINPWLGLIEAAAHYVFGINITDIFQKIISKIAPKLTAGEPITSAEVNQAGQEAASSITTASKEELQLFANGDFFGELRNLERNGQLTIAANYKNIPYLLTKQAQTSKLTREFSSQPFGGGNETNTLFRVFSFLKSNGKSGNGLIVGILVWIVKTSLLAAGLLLVGNLAASLIKPHQNQTKNSPGPISPPSSVPDAPTSAPVQTQIPSSTGTGAFIFRKNPSDIWIEDLNGDQPQDLIMDWAEDNYPILNQYEDIIKETPSFWNTVKTFARDWPRGQNKITVPKEFNKKDDVINMFIKDVFQKIQQKKVK